MYEKNVLLILVDHRHESAVEVQKILTANGCMIKTRLGLHDVSPECCSPHGLMFLELVGTKEEQIELEKSLTGIKGVKVQLVSLSI